jgi:type VI secretion system protein ImpB
VENKLSGQENAGKLGVDLTFKSLDDFNPEQVAMQVEPLRDLLALRQRLSNLRANLQTNQTLDDQLQALINSSEKMNKLRTQRESDEPKPGDGGAE